jgi:hypothetical protein
VTSFQTPANLVLDELLEPALEVEDPVFVVPGQVAGVNVPVGAEEGRRFLYNSGNQIGNRPKQVLVSENGFTLLTFRDQRY